MATPSEEDPKPSPLPPYPEMILAAISALGESTGSSKSAISRQIESSYGELLPPSHASLLAAHLARMAETGELVQAAGGIYFRAGPGAPPPKRGRGRPPKPRLPLPPGVAARPRGRPPKPTDPSAPVKIPRPRGRPRKHPRPEGEDAAAAVVAPPRPRGRPPKVNRSPFTEVGFV